MGGREASIPTVRLLLACLAATLAATLATRAQSSPSYRIEQMTLNAGGRPLDGNVAVSASFRITVDALGDTVAGGVPSGPSYFIDSGLPAGLRLPGEVLNLRFTDRTRMTWTPERSAGSYFVYRDRVSTLPGDYGGCFASGLGTDSAVDSAAPTAGQAFFYIVTVRNRIGEEGTKGRATSGADRSNPNPCP